MRKALLSCAVALALGAAIALSQSGALSSVTMRVVDDLSGIDAVLIELEPARADGV